MSRRSFWFLAAVLLAFPASVQAATYRYQSRPMLLVPVEGGYTQDGEPVELPAQTTETVVFWVDLGYLGNRLADTRINASIEPWSGDTEAVAFRGGKQIAVQNEATPVWINISGEVDSFGASFWVLFDARADVLKWGYSTDGENTTLSLGGAYDSLYRGTESNYLPGPPQWISDGPGTWVHSPVPVPVPATALLLLTAVGACATLRSRRTAGHSAIL